MKTGGVSLQREPATGNRVSEESVMGSVNEWETLFDHHAPRYMDEPWTKDTSSEVDFLVEELAILPGGSILDLGCGTGRHAIEFASRGYKVTGG